MFHIVHNLSGIYMYDLNYKFHITKFNMKIGHHIVN